MTTDLDTDPRLDDVLRRTFEAVADQTMLTSAATSSPVVRLDSVIARGRGRAPWRRPVGAALAGAAAATIIAIGLSRDPEPAPEGPTVDVASGPAAGAAGSDTAAGGGPDVQAQRFRELVAGEIRIEGVGNDVSVWSDADDPVRMYVALVGDDATRLDLVVDLTMFGPGEHRDEPAWAQEVAEASAPGTAVPEGLLFLDDDGYGAAIVSPHGLVRVRLQPDVDPKPTTEELTELVRQVAAGTASFVTKG